MVTSDSGARAHRGALLLGVIVPTRWEARDIFRRFSFRKNSAGLYQTVVNGRSLLLCISGTGRAAARKAAARLVEAGAGELMSAGFCGALVPELKVGDLVTHRIATVDVPARTPGERQALTERANAVAVDMETQAVVEEATRRGVPIRVLRVVSDTFADDLTPLLGRSRSFSAWMIALHLLNPAVWPLAFRLKRQSGSAKAALAEALEQSLKA
jgi:nucleoside phosphorylase